MSVKHPSVQNIPVFYYHEKVSPITLEDVSFGNLGYCFADSNQSLFDLKSPPVSSQLPLILAIQILAATLSRMQTVCKSQYLPVVDGLTPPSRHPFSSQTKASPPSSDSTV